MEKFFDLIVLGAGSGGLAAAKRAAKHGAKVAIVERDRVGGTCVIRGCVPKKLLVYGSMYREYVDHSSSYGVDIKNVSFNTKVLLKNVRQEVDRLNALHLKFLESAGVEIFQGWGHFINSNSIAVTKSTEKTSQLIIKANYILIAVGGRPSLPKISGLNHCWVSDDMFLLDKFPGELIVVGGGFIACEFACILNNLGVKVKQLVRGRHLLKGFDNDLSDVLLKHMKNKGIEIFFKESPLAIKSHKGLLDVITESGLKINSKAVLLATGRKPFLEPLRLKTVGIETVKERIVVNEYSQTNISNIYAVGDVTNRFNLTPVAIDEGRAFADRLFSNKDRIVNYSLIPSAVFSQPEIAAVGLTESGAKKLYGKNEILIYRASFNSMSRALPKEGSPCLLKLVVNSNNKKILGCHMVGEHAAEIVQMASIAIGMGASKSDFDNTMALHPTIAEEFVTMT